MKTKDIVYTILTVVIFAVAGYLIFTMLIPQSSKTAAKVQKVEVVDAIESSMSSTTLDQLSDKTKNIDYSTALDLTRYMNNGAIFGQ